ncbi:MAG: lytic transglycosylase domain-containing protein [Pseudolabrys sp.]
MRHLFLPTCFCLMTLSGSTGPDSAASMESFSGAEPSGAKTLTQTDLRTAVPPAVAEQTEEHDSSLGSSLGPSPDSSLADSMMETPAQAGLDGTMLPRPRPAYADRAVSRSPREICDTVIAAAQSNNLPIPFFVHLLHQESGFQPNVVSRAGAQGIAQFMPETAATVGLANPFDPLQAIAASARLLRDLAKQFGNLGLAAAAYNAGPRRIQDWLAKKGKLPEETQNYVKTITGRPAKTWMAAAPGSVALTVPRAAPCQEAAGLIAANDAEHRVQAAAKPVLHSKAMIAARARVKMARFGAEKTPTITVAEHSSPGGAPKDAPNDVAKQAARGASKLASKPASMGAGGVASHVAQAGKATKNVTQLAAASTKKGPHKVRLSQR